MTRLDLIYEHCEKDALPSTLYYITQSAVRLWGLHKSLLAYTVSCLWTQQMTGQED